MCHYSRCFHPKHPHTSPSGRLVACGYNLLRYVTDNDPVLSLGMDHLKEAALSSGTLLAHRAEAVMVLILDKALIPLLGSWLRPRCHLCGIWARIWGDS